LEKVLLVWSVMDWPSTEKELEAWSPMPWNMPLESAETPGEESVTSDTDRGGDALDRNLGEEITVDIGVTDGVGFDKVAAGGGDVDNGAGGGDL